MNHQYTCFFCKAHPPTLQGLRSHISQRRECCTAYRARVLGDPQPQDQSIPPVNDQDIQDSPIDIAPPENDEPSAEHVDLSSPQPPSKRARVEEVEDEEAGGLPKDPFVRWDQAAGRTFGTGKTLYAQIEEEREKKGLPGASWKPWDGGEEWDLVKWLLACGISQQDLDRYIKLKIVSTSKALIDFVSYLCTDTQPHSTVLQQ